MGYPYSNGDVLSHSDMNAVGLHLITPSSVTNGTLDGAVVVPGTAVSSVTVNGVFSNNFQNYKVQYYGGTGSTLVALNLTLGSTTTGYYWAYRYITYSAGAEFTNNFGNDSRFVNVGEISNTNGNMMDCDIYGPNMAKPTGITWHGSFQSVSLWGAGRLGNTSQYTGFTVTPNSGTMTGGRLMVYGYSNG